MRRALRLLALLTAVAVIGTWLATGAHRGWTKTKVTTMEVEPVTGLEHPIERDQFVMGVELLGAGLAFAAGLGVVSIFFRKPKTIIQSTTV